MTGFCLLGSGLHWTRVATSFIHNARIHLPRFFSLLSSWASCHLFSNSFLRSVPTHVEQIYNLTTSLSLFFLSAIKRKKRKNNSCSYSVCVCVSSKATAHIRRLLYLSVYTLHTIAKTWTWNLECICRLYTNHGHHSHLTGLTDVTQWPRCTTHRYLGSRVYL